MPFTLTGKILRSPGTPAVARVTATPSVSPLRVPAEGLWLLGGTSVDLDADGAFTMSLHTADGIVPPTFTYRVTVHGPDVGFVAVDLVPLADGETVDLVDLI